MMAFRPDSAIFTIPLANSVSVEGSDTTLTAAGVAVNAGVLPGRIVQVRKKSDSSSLSSYLGKGSKR